MVKTIKFKEYLAFVHNELYPQVLDDDLPDHFDDWIGSLEVDEIKKLITDWELEKQK